MTIDKKCELVLERVDIASLAIADLIACRWRDEIQFKLAICLKNAFCIENDIFRRSYGRRRRRPKVLTAPEKIMKMFLDNWKINLQGLADILKISEGRAFDVLSENLGNRRLFSKWNYVYQKGNKNVNVSILNDCRPKLSTRPSRRSDLGPNKLYVLGNIKKSVPGENIWIKWWSCFANHCGNRNYSIRSIERMSNC